MKLIREIPDGNEGASCIADLPDGRRAFVYPQIFTGKLAVGEPDAPCFDDSWCYNSVREAERALEAWDGQGEPSGWHRHHKSGRRRPDGDPEQEYINL